MIALLVYVVITVLIFAWIVLAYTSPKTRRKGKGRTLMVVLGSGGHTMEMMSLLSSTLHVPPTSNDQEKGTAPKIHVHYVVASGDVISLEKVKAFSGVDHARPLSTTLTLIPRSRKVHQSYFSSIFTTLYAAVFVLSFLPFQIPDLILCNGPGTCVPIVFVTILLNALNPFHSIKVMYIESFARVKSLSLTGKLLYHVPGVTFVVQWPQLKRRYPKATYLGRLI